MDKRKHIYILTIVSLSEQEYANGFCDAECYDDYNVAIEKLKEWKESEITDCKESGYDCKVVTDKPDEFHATWNDGKEQVFIRLLIRKMNGFVTRLQSEK